MKILVTGGVGNVGPAVIERLVRAGHTVRFIGRRPGMRFEGAQYVQCDVTDIACLKAQAAGMDAVVHLAAISGPHQAPPEEVFRVNCLGTFNVYEAAANAGIRRVVQASSINALGFGFGVRDFTVHSVPIDEDHPTTPTDAYSYSKNIAEHIAEYHWRRDGISGCSLRIPATVPFPHYEEKPNRDFVTACRAEAAVLLALDPRERREKVAGWLRLLEEGRSRRVFERPPEDWKGLFPESMLMGCRADFWTAVDARDSAQAFEKAVTLPYEGSHPLFINDGCNRTGVPSRTLMELFYPGGRITWKKNVKGYDGLVSIERARSFLGYEPAFSALRFIE
jgi:nucleoside-diphosphate-sugar epimerase